MATSGPGVEPPLHPLHAMLLGFPIALFTGALASDITYLNTAEIQWTNFSQWLIAAALLFGAPVVLFAIVRLVRAPSSNRKGRAGAYLLTLVLMWLAGLINAFHHSRDGWSSVGTVGLILSVAATALALVAGWIGYSSGNGRAA